MYSQERAAFELRPEGSTGGKRGSGQTDAQQIEWSGEVLACLWSREVVWGGEKGNMVGGDGVWRQTTQGLGGSGRLVWMA